MIKSEMMGHARVIVFERLTEKFEADGLDHDAASKRAFEEIQFGTHRFAINEEIRKMQNHQRRTTKGGRS